MIVGLSLEESLLLLGLLALEPVSEQLLLKLLSGKGLLYLSLLVLLLVHIRRLSKQLLEIEGLLVGVAMLTDHSWRHGCNQSWRHGCSRGSLRPQIVQQS